MLRALLLFLTAACALFAQQGFLKLDEIKGEATDKDHKDWIEVLGFAFSAKVPQTNAQAFGRAATAPTGMDTITIYKRFDAASPKLLESCFLGRRLTEGTLELTRSQADAPRFAEVTLRDIIVTAIQIDHSISPGSEPVELLTLQFGRAEWCYQILKPDGSAGGRVCTTINIATGAGR